MDGKLGGWREVQVSFLCSNQNTGVKYAFTFFSWGPLEGGYLTQEMLNLDFEALNLVYWH
jgi:hypothetical protein